MGPQMLKMTGLKNCDTCRKAQKWLKENHIEYTYRDVKVDGVPKVDLERYVLALGWDKAINKASTSWRGLSDSEKENIDNVKAVCLLLDNPSLMKRPLFEFGDEIILGFKDSQKEKLLTLK